MMITPCITGAGQLPLWGTADGTSKYTELFSNSFYQMALCDPGTTQQRFHDIDNPSIEYGLTNYDGFPHDANFRLGHITYDDSSLVGGTGTATITGLTFNMGADPDDATYYNYYRWTDLVTTVNSASGTVQLLNGSLISMNLASNISFSAYGGIFTGSGTFDVNGLSFDGYLAGAPGQTQIAYDFSGTLLQIPEPASIALLALGLPGLLKRPAKRQ